MAYTTPRTWTAGETVTATMMNAHVRDNMTDLRTAKHCRAYATGTQSLTNNTFEAITFGAETYDTDAWHSTGSNTERITPLAAGLYLVVGSLEFASHVTGLRALRLLINSSTIGQTTVGATATGAPMLTCSALYRANGSSDYFQMHGYQNSGGALNTSTTTSAPWLHVTWIGA